MYRYIPGRHWGVQLQKRWAAKVQEWQQRQKQIYEVFFEEIEKVSKEAKANIKKFQEQGDALMKEKKYDEAAKLSGGYEKIIIAQRSLPKQLPARELPIAAVLKLELGLESVKASIIHAELVNQTMMVSKGSESDVEERTTNESIENSHASLMIKGSAGEIEEEKRKRLFQQCAEALENYAEKTLSIVYDVFSFFNSEGDLGDETDANDLEKAWDEVETEAWGLHVLREKTTSGEYDFLLPQKQELAITDLEKAIKATHEIAQRIGSEENYERDKKANSILTNLQKAKKEYEASQQDEK